MQDERGIENLAPGGKRGLVWHRPRPNDSRFPTRHTRAYFHNAALMRKYIIPALVAGFGFIWLLDTLGVVPPLNVVWTLSLLGVGICVFLIHGFHKESFPWGSFFIACSVCSVLRQMDFLSIRIELPLLVILLGSLLAINQTGLIPPHPRGVPPPMPPSL